MKPHALAELIEQVKRERDLSDEDLAVRARRAGHQISKQHISAIRHSDPLKSLVPSTLRALADALGKPLHQVVEAALPAAGLPTTSRPVDWSIEAAIAADHELPAAAKRMLLAMLATARNEQSTVTRAAFGKRPPRLPAKQTAAKAARRGLER
jgi:hypothetical protein